MVFTDKFQSERLYVKILTVDDVKMIPGKPKNFTELLRCNKTPMRKQEQKLQEKFYMEQALKVNV